MKSYEEFKKEVYLRAEKKKNAMRNRRGFLISAAVATSAVIIVVLVTVSMNNNKKESGNNKVEENKKEVIDGEIVLIKGDRVIYTDFDSLMNASDIVVIGEFVSDSEQNIKEIFNTQYNKNIISDIESTCLLKIKKAFKGDVNIGDEIVIIQRYGIDPDNGNLISFSELTPMYKGDKWIYFLEKGEKDGKICYYATGDYCGRYPLGVIGEANAEKFGVYDENCVNVELYKTIKEKLEI